VPADSTVDLTTAVDRLRRCVDPEQIAQDTLAFVRVRSETGAEGPGSEFLAELLRREGLEPTLDEVAPGRPNVYACLRGEGSGPALLLNGHTDTIPVGVSTPPARDGEWVVGRGTEDMKGGLVAMVHAASALRRAGLHLAGDLWLTGVVGHETPVGKKEGPRQLIRRLGEGQLHADAILIVEGPDKVWSASLGSAVFEMTLTSPRGAIHNLYAPYAENPARAAGRVLTRFEEWERRFEAGTPHPTCGRERVNVGIVRGGDFMNRLPTPLEIVGQRRWTPGKTVADVRAEFDALCAEISAEGTVTATYSLEGVREPFETAPNHPLVQALVSAGRAERGTPPEVIGMALVGDANIYANEGGVPTAYYGPAYRTAHSDDERVPVSQLAHCAHVYALTALAYCGGGF
jgi:succinyl-diaminopimelate desuccinylase